FAGTFPLVAGLITMGVYHAVIGILEGLVTIAAIYLITSVRPDLVETGAIRGKEAGP
ncbi:MAG: energy-coupling factor ABC transporter permease, partial [Methanoregula sp.]|nr:energy-coupling factor ABC transporter permease [Methanoregula sp.]